METSLRQFCASLFCRAVPNKNGEYTNRLELDLSRIPEEATALREFFAPRGVPRDIRELVNDGSEKTRDAWAKVTSGLLYVDYNKTNCEMFGNWPNFIKAFCYLMKGYTKANGSEEAAERIKDINDAAEAGTLSFTKETFLKTLNDLLKIRTDIEMRTEESKSGFAVGGCHGEVAICPNLDSEKYGKGVIKGNRLNFLIGDHGQLSSIPKQIISRKDYNEKKPWAERLYDSKELAVRGKTAGSQLSNSAYPFLDFYMTMGGEFGNRGTLFEMFSSSTPHVDAIARYRINGGIFYEIMFGEKISQDTNSWKRKKRRFCESVFMFLDKMNIVEEVMRILSYEITPEELSELFLKRDTEGVEKLSVDITDKTSIEKLIALRVITKRYEEIDPFIERFIERTYSAEAFNVTREQAFDVLKAFSNDVLKAFYILKTLEIEGASHRFNRFMFDTFVKCIKGILESPVKDRCDVRDIIDYLSLMDCDENNPKFKEFIEFAAKKMNSTKEKVLSEIR